MKYNQVNWLEWPGSPDEQTFNDWVITRKSNKHPVLTHTAMRKYSAQVARLVQDGVCDVETAFRHAAENGWRAIMYDYVVTAIHKEMDCSTGYKAYHACKKSTRELTLHDELNDTSWAQ